MGLAFLPWERLPSWILGPLLVALNIYLILDAKPCSWRQVESGLFIMVGIAMTVHGVYKLRLSLKQEQLSATGDSIK